MKRSRPRPTLRLLAARAGVSVSTVSRALADNPAISRATREKIQHLAAELGYRPNAQARALRSSRTGVVAVVVPRLVNLYFAELVEAVQNAAQDEGLSCMIFSTRSSVDAFRTVLAKVSESAVDGAIVVPHEAAAADLHNLRSAGLPLVLLDRSLPDSPLPTVVSDPAPGMAQALERIPLTAPVGYLAGPQDTSTGRERRSILLQLAAQRQLEVLEYAGGYRQSNGRDGARSLLDAGARSLFAGDSMMTLGVLECCLERGLVIGEDLTLIGFDDNPAFRMQPHPIPTVRQDVVGMGTRALQLLLAELAGEDSSQQQWHIPTTFEGGEQ